MSNNFAPEVDLSGLNPLIAEELLRADPEMAVDQQNAAGFMNVVNIADKGVLTGVCQSISAFTAAGWVQLNVSIDGVSIFSGHFLACSQVGDQNSIEFNHRFETSLLVRAGMNAAGVGTEYTHVAFTIDE